MSLHALQKRIGFFNLWMVTLVADKLRRLWLWEVYVGIANCISNLSPNRTLQQPEHLWGSHYNYTSKMPIKAGNSHRCSVVTISARSWLLLHAFWYKTVWRLPQWLLTARSSVVTNCKILVVRYGLGVSCPPRARLPARNGLVNGVEFLGLIPQNGGRPMRLRDR